MLILLVINISDYEISNKTQLPTSLPPTISSSSTNSPTPIDLARAKEIMQGVISDPNYMSSSIRGEFWRLIDENGGASNEQIKSIREKVSYKVAVYDRHFFEDALESLHRGQSYKSQNREDDEQYLLSNGLATTDSIQKAEAFLTKVINKEPLTVNGQAVIFDEPLLKRALSNIDAIQQRLDMLFTRP